MVTSSSAMRLLRAAPRTTTFVAHSMRRPLRIQARHPHIPTRLVTPGLVASVWLDEMAVALLPTIALPDLPLPQVREETDATVAVLDANGWLQDPRRFHLDPPAPETPTLSREHFGRIRYEHLSFESGYEPRTGIAGSERWLSVAPNRIAHAFVLRHREELRPWVVHLHGYSVGNPADLLLFRSLRLHRTLGLNVLHVVAPLHGPRRAPGRKSGDGIISFDYPKNVHAFAQAIWDIRRCLAWVRAQGSAAIAVHGVSLGGFTAALLAGVDDRIDVVIAGVPAADISWAMTRNVPKRMLGELESHGLLGPAREAIHRVISPLAMGCLVPLDGRHIYAGVADRMTTPAQASLLWNHWEQPAMCWYAGSHCASGWSREVRRFVEETLRATVSRLPS